MNRSGIHPLFLVAVLFVMAAPIFWMHTHAPGEAVARSYENADLYQRIYPQFHYGFKRLREGDLPLWNSGQLCGAPFQADPSSGLFQPLNLVFVWLPTEKALAIHGFVCIALMGLGMTLFARSQGLGYVASLVGASVYAFNGTAAGAVTRPGLAAVLVWTPFVLWSLREHARTSGHGRGWQVALFLAFLLLSGSPGGTLAMLLLVGPYALALLSQGPGTEEPEAHRLRRQSVSLLKALLAAVGLSAAQWLPTLAWVRLLAQPGAALWNVDFDAYVSHSLGESLAHLLTARPASLPHVNYFGVASLLVLPAALFHKKERLDTLFFVTAAPVALLLATVSKENAPLSFPFEAFTLPVALAVSALVAIGADRLLSLHTRYGVSATWGPGAVILATACVLFYISDAAVRGRILATVVVLVPFLVLRNQPGVIISGSGLVVFLFVDLVAASTNQYRHPFQDAPGCYEVHQQTIKTAEEQALNGRVLVASHPLDVELPANLGMLYPVQVVGGRYIPLLKNQALWWDHLRSARTGSIRGNETVAVPTPENRRYLDLMAMSLIIAGRNSPLASDGWLRTAEGFRLLGTPTTPRLILNSQSLPRAYWVPEWRLAEGPEEAMALVGAPEFDANRLCAVDASGAAALTRIAAPDREIPPLLNRLSANCTLRPVSAERVAIHVDAPADGITVLADTFAPGWRAHIDGVATPILNVNGLFRGVVTPKGRHEIVFVYAPMSLRVGLVVCAVTAGIAAGMVGYGRWRKRRL